jgi:hypothetical protein
VAFAWWCVASALYVVSAALFICVVAILGAANPAARLPWTGWPPNSPWTAKALGLFATMTDTLAMNCVAWALGRRHLYDFLWGMPLSLIVAVVAAVPQVRHNRRVRRAV